MIHVCLIDDHEIARIGVREMLADTEISIVQESSQVQGFAPSVQAQILVTEVVLDSRIVFRELTELRQRSPQMRVLIYTAFDNPTFVKQAIDLGFAGYVLKTASRDELLTAVRKAANEAISWSSHVQRQVTGAMATARSQFDTEIPLTLRESDILQRVSRGLTNKEIAGELSISHETVKEHVKNMLRKIGVADRTQAAVWAVRKGFISPTVFSS
jgi:DNA-binding NarL/FixJ family response regulator